jgi:hypothetical protein
VTPAEPISRIPARGAFMIVEQAGRRRFHGRAAVVTDDISATIRKHGNKEGV